MHLLIVDDSNIIRNGLKKIVEENCPAFTKISEAGNGADGFTILKTQSPDVCITDIRMPKMDGIEMIRRSREQGIKTHFIALSGYAEFEYARSLLNLNCSAYLLKPVKHFELIAALEATGPEKRSPKDTPLCCVSDGSMQWELYSESETSPLRQMFNNMLTQEMSKEVAFAQQMVMQGECYGVMFQATSKSVPPSNREPSALSPGNFAREICTVLAKAGGQKFLCCAVESNIVVTLLVPPKTPDTKQWLAGIIRRTLERYPWNRTDFTIGCAGPLDSHQSLFYIFRMLQFTMSKRFYTNAPGIYWYTEQPPFEDNIFYQKMERDIVHFLETENFEGVNNGLAQTMEKFKADSVPREQCLLFLSRLYLTLRTILKTQQFTLLLDALPRISHFQYDLHDIQSFDEMEKYIGRMIARIAEITDLEEDGDEMIIRRVRRYIESNYTANITLTQAANVANMSPSYFSSYFKKITGETYVSFVSRVKIAKAKDMLMRDEMKIYEISRTLGYMDSKYFSKLFLRLTGKTPREYRESNFNPGIMPKEEVIKQQK